MKRLSVFGLVFVGSVAVAGSGEASAPTFAVSPEFTIAGGITPADSDTTNPGRPAIGFDGTNYLVVSCRELGSPTGLFAVRLSKGGVALDTFHISPSECPAPASVAFDGTNYLVVFERAGQIFATRVSQAGVVLDGPSGFALSSGIPFVVTNFAPAVAFDGVNYLVVWNKFVDGTHDIFGARVTPDGNLLEEIPIFTAPGEQVFASVAFDGVNYLVVWRDTRSGSGPSPDTDIFATRVTPAGIVLDQSGSPISTAPGVQGEPGVAFDGANYFVVWVDGRAGVFGRFDIFGRRIKPDGTLLDGPSDTGGIAINTGATALFAKAHPAVTFDGENYWVAWAIETFPSFPPAGIFAARVSAGGVLLDGPPEGEGIAISKPACFACRVVHPNILFNGDSALLAWVVNSEVFGTTKDIAGVLIQINPVPTLTASPASVTAGGTVTATWSGIPSPTATDWIGLYAAGAADSDFVDWMYVSCSKTAGSAAAAGSCPFPIPAGASPGTYELRLFANDAFTTLTTSNTFTVTP